MKKYLITLIIIILIFAGVFISRKKTKKEVAKEYIKKVAIEVIEKGNVSAKKEFYGKVQGIEQTEVYPDVPGKFIKYRVKEGQFVKKGSIIAEIDRSIPGMQFESAKVKAPISGIVYSLELTKGTPVMQQRPVAMIANTSKIIARIDVSNTVLRELNKNSKVDIEIDSLFYTGKILRVSKFPNNMTRLGSVDVLINSKNMDLINDECVVYIYTANKNNTIRIPRNAYHIMNNEEYVYVYSNNTAIKTNVKAGIKGNQYIEIKEGLNEGDTIITIGSSIIRDKQKVRI